jgi:hypothetical protein
MPDSMVCAADFLTFQMHLLIGADSFSLLIANLYGKVRGSQGIYSLESGNPVHKILNLSLTVVDGLVALIN